MRVSELVSLCSVCLVTVWTATGQDFLSVDTDSDRIQSARWASMFKMLN